MKEDNAPAPRITPAIWLVVPLLARKQCEQSRTASIQPIDHGVSFGDDRSTVLSHLSGQHCFRASSGTSKNRAQCHPAKGRSATDRRPGITYSDASNGEHMTDHDV